MHVSQQGDAKIGGVKYDFDVDIYSPQTLAVGIGYNITPKFLITGSVKWSDWSYFDRSKSTMDNVEFPFSKNSRDGFRYTFGCEYTVSDLLTLRAGFLYDPYSIKREWISPTLADATFYNVAIGASFTIEKYKIDIFLSGSKIESRKVSYSQAGYTGKYEGHTFPFTGIDVTYSF
jgi:long-chain fatty acid transport protein